MTDKEHAKKYARESISLAISMHNPKAEDIAFYACLYGLTYKNDEIKKLKEGLEEKIADIKANCDLAIEGRDVKIMELKEQLKKAKEYLKQTLPYLEYLDEESEKLYDRINEFIKE